MEDTTKDLVKRLNAWLDGEVSNTATSLISEAATELESLRKDAEWGRLFLRNCSLDDAIPAATTSIDALFSIKFEAGKYKTLREVLAASSTADQMKDKAP